MRRLLVIDDEPIVLDLMLEILREAGFHVLGAATADEGLNLLRTHDVAAVVSDINMPGLSGLELLGRLGEIRPGLPIVLVTGAGTYEHLREALARGAGALVLKPFSHAELVAAVEEALARNARREQDLRNRLLTPTLATALANAIELRDAATGGHCERLAAVAVRLAERCGLPDHELECVRLGAILHDVGKIGIADSILLKPGPLDPDELRLMRTHPLIGDHLLSTLDLLARVRPIVRHHHERWDGAGYPDGLHGEAIPRTARIVAVADALEAMSSRRPYRGPLSLDEILRELDAGAGTQWDAELVQVVLGLIREGELEFTSDGVAVRETVRTEPQRPVPSVLLIEDNPEHAVLATEAIEDALGAVHVLHALDLASATELCRNSVWSLAVVDQHLPDGSGLDAIDSLHAAAPELPILMLTGQDSTSVAVEAFRRGASDYVAKVNGYGDDLRDRVRLLMQDAS